MVWISAGRGDLTHGCVLHLHRGGPGLNLQTIQTMKTKSKLAITLLLVVSILEFGEAQAVGPEEPPPQQLQACGAMCVVGLIVVAIGVSIAVALARFCKKHLPPTTPPSPPNPPSNTNGPSNLVIRSMTTPLPVLTFDDDGVDMWDIASYGWNDTDGYRYSVLVNATIESSTNMSNWELMASLKAWCSISNVLTVVYDPSGAPVSTNYTRTGTNGIPLTAVPSLGGQPSMARFFRLKTPVL